MKKLFAQISVYDAMVAAQALAEKANETPVDSEARQLNNVSNALYALANDTDFIVTDPEVVPEA